MLAFLPRKLFKQAHHPQYNEQTVKNLHLKNWYSYWYKTLVLSSEGEPQQETESTGVKSKSANEKPGSHL